MLVALLSVRAASSGDPRERNLAAARTWRVIDSFLCGHTVQPVDALLVKAALVADRNVVSVHENEAVEGKARLAADLQHAVRNRANNLMEGGSKRHGGVEHNQDGTALEGGCLPERYAETGRPWLGRG